MLIEFSVSNFMSFQEENTLSMNATADDTMTDCWVATTGKRALLRGALIYGANASGKSNLLKAVQFSQQMILTSAQGSQSGEPLEYRPFKLEKQNAFIPSRFQYIFIVEETTYRYGFEMNRDGIVSEWLYANYSSRESMLFERTKNGFQIGNKMAGGRTAVPHTRDNALFLSVAALLNNGIAKRMLMWFRSINVINGLHGDYYHVLAGALLDETVSQDVKKLAFQLIKEADVGIDGLKIRRSTFKDAVQRKLEKAEVTLPDDFDADMPEEVKKQFINELEIVHQMTTNGQPNGETVSFELADESDGTQKLIGLVGPLMDTLLHDKVLLIDEFSASLHESMSISLLMLFRDLGKQENRKSQMIMTTHHTRFLSQEFIRRDQVWLIEKSKKMLPACLHYQISKVFEKTRRWKRTTWQGCSVLCPNSPMIPLLNNDGC